MRSIIALILTATASLAVAAPATQRVTDKAAHCGLNVPADWTATFVKSSMQSPGNHSNVIVSYSDMSKSLAEVKPIATRMMQPTKTFEDSASRLWYQYEGNEGTGTHWYVAVPGKGGVCLAQITFKQPADEPAMKAIALSLAPN